MLKRVAILLFCLIMIFIATFGFVVGVVTVPTIYSYAAVNDDPIYVPLRSENDAVKAFQAYCKSRDLTIEGSLTDAVTTFTTGVFNSACNELGIDITELQAEIKAEYDNAGEPVKFLFNDTGVMAMNRIFAQFLQDNELEVGDSANQQDNTVYNGEYFIDDNGNYCLMTIFANDTSNSFPYDLSKSKIVNIGTQFIKQGGLNAKNTWDNAGVSYNTIVPYVVFTYASNTYTLYVKRIDKLTSIVSRYTSGGNSYYYSSNNGVLLQYGYPTIFKGPSNRYYYGILCFNSDGTLYNACLNGLISLPSGASFTNVNIYLTTNNTVINNNNYEGDTIINNEGDVIVEPDPVPPGGTDPGWDIGGGGGNATDGNGNTWNIQFPDFELPDLNIDWSINGLGEKFPFSIPFDLVSLVTVLNAEPQAPRFEGTVNFGFTTWNYDINLQQFDSVAQACRIAELLLLVVGLILVTRSIIKG